MRIRAFARNYRPLKGARSPALFILIALLGASAACSSGTGTPPANLPNPAAVFCEEQGHTYIIRTAADGSQSGVCILSDGTECDAWAYQRGECPPTPRAFVPGECPFDVPANLTVECGTLVVPEVRGAHGSGIEPGGREIRLAVAILRHPDGSPEPDPIVYLEGGPGGSALEIRTASLEALFGPFFPANRDIIVFDQRGVGFSEPALDCPGFTERYLDLLDAEVDGKPLSSQEILDAKAEALLACAEDLRAVADLSAYNTVASAADVNDLRVALGYERVNLWGTSYGTRLALGVMRDYPQSVRSAVLDAPYGPEVDLFAATPGSFDRALTVLEDECAADAACGAAYPDLRAVLVETVERLNADPATITVIHPRTRATYEKVLDGNGLAEIVFRSLYDTSMRPLLPQAIYEAREGRFTALVPVAMLDILRQEWRSWGMYLSVLCNEEIPFGTHEGFEAVLADYPEFAGFFRGFEVGGLAYAVCPGWGAGQADARENEPVRSDVPTLILTGQYDPIVPTGWGQQAAQTLVNSSFFEFRGMGHGVSWSSCAQTMMLAFLEDPSARPDDACLAESEVAPFVVPAPAADVTLEAFDSAELGLRGVVPAGWNQVQPGLFARGNPVSDLAVLQIAVEKTMDAQELLDAMAKGYGLAGAPEPTGEHRSDDTTWSLYTFLVQGIPRDLALAESQAGTLVVLLRSAPDERDALYETVFVPVVDALVPFK